MDSPSDYVIVTQYTTVYPTDFAQASTTSANVSSASRNLTTVASSKVRLSSTAPASTFSTLISSSSTMPTSSTTSILPSSSITGVPSAPPRHEFDDTTVGIFAAAFAVLGLLLLVTVCYMIYLRFQGKCPRCNDMEKQLEKWQSGELKCITPGMVREREAINKAASSSNTSSGVEIEMTTFGGATAARSAVLDQPKPTKQLTFWDKAKCKFFYIRKEEESTSDLESAPETQDTLYVPHAEATHYDAGPSRRVSSERPQSPLEYEQNLNHLYQPRASTIRASTATYDSNYSQPEATQPYDALASRVFTDYAPSVIAQPRGPLRKEDDEPSRYSAFVAAEKQQRLQEAEATLQSDEYKQAEYLLKRGTASDERLRRALSIVNLADQAVNKARNPTLYLRSSTPSPTGQAGPVQVEQYEMPAWRKRGYKAPESDAS
ncbi:hypothetical protein A1F94_006721 [Pyrenophora tritici-repentis]|nr:hypothetical protein PtrV1_13875 [Pyrenophora tritici-repentis]KAA8612334.1 hypothetical protein PtrV1_12903 [Pyrenophora tritici-repentis]KAF7447136.1 hypothetical protein A1F99_085830 [Pyrenophora tritici-repentis]KAF7569432.1 hypothetical protein PtrM4_118470 [Pyrenophora tritici-repentis]KAG9382800.1 hypothetical protein A1F94_006721 [Pyrenophora tritici-repentis]